MHRAALTVVAEHLGLQQLADRIVAVQRAAAARVLELDAAQRVALHAQGQRIGVAEGIDDLDRQAARIVFDAPDRPVQPDLFDQIVVAVVAEAVGFAVLVDRAAMPLPGHVRPAVDRPRIARVVAHHQGMALLAVLEPVAQAGRGPAPRQVVGVGLVELAGVGHHLARALHAPLPHGAAQPRRTVAYARVSSHDQKRDLERQQQLLELYCAAQGWTFNTIADVGSGMNYHKKGLKKLLGEILDGNIGRLVVVHQDRLLRFGAELVFSMCQAKEVEVVIINQGEDRSFEEDLVSDVLEIVTVFSARRYGSRSHRNQKLIDGVKAAVKDAQ